MQKRKQFISAALLGGVGIILTTIGRFSASADQLIPSGLTFTVIMIVGLVLMIVAAIWFFWLSARD